MTPTRSRAAQVSRRDGFTLIELLIVVAIIGIVASIAIPSLSAARASANEASAIGSARTASSAQSAYAVSCGDGVYAPSALQLTMGGFAQPDFAQPIKHGFAFTIGVGDLGVLGPIDCDGNPTVTDWYFSATPTSPNLGRRGFAVDETGGIWVDHRGRRAGRAVRRRRHHRARCVDLEEEYDRVPDDLPPSRVASRDAPLVERRPVRAGVGLAGVERVERPALHPAGRAGRDQPGPGRQRSRAAALLAGRPLGGLAAAPPLPAAPAAPTCVPIAARATIAPLHPRT